MPVACHTVFATAAAVPTMPISPTPSFLAGLARFLAAHTSTRRELSRVVDIATRLRSGEDLFEAE